MSNDLQSPVTVDEIRTQDLSLTSTAHDHKLVQIVHPSPAVKCLHLHVQLQCSGDMNITRLKNSEECERPFNN